MITQRGLLNQALKEQRNILQKEGLEKEFRRLQRRFKKEIGSKIYLYCDSCPEFFEGYFYVTEIVEIKTGNLIYVCARPSVPEVLRELEDYINE